MEKNKKYEMGKNNLLEEKIKSRPEK